MKRPIAALILLAPLVLAPCVRIDACAPAPSPGEQVRIVDEQAVIVWNPATQREDFVRNANFDATGKSFGFLVPTPTVPTLTQANPAVFDELDALRPPPPPRPSGQIIIGMAAPATAEAPPVSVVYTQQVAGYDATVLQANDASALHNWLTSHGYAAPAGFDDWIAPYVSQGWSITAFKITAPDPSAQPASAAPATSIAPVSHVSSGLVRISFATDRPLYPYREPGAPAPAIPPIQARSLRVYLVSDQPMQGQFGSGVQGAWPGREDFRAPVPAAEMPRLASNLAETADQLPNTPYLTVFQDDSSPRPAVADVWFSPAPQPQLLTAVTPTSGRAPMADYRSGPPIADHVVDNATLMRRVTVTGVVLFAGVILAAFATIRRRKA